MTIRRFIPLGFALASLLALVACGDNDEVTGSGQSFARLVLDVPNEVRSGETFTTRFDAENVGLHDIENVAVVVALPAPLRAVSVSEDGPGTAVFSNDSSGGHVTWTIGTLDANEDLTLRITTTGTLAASESSRKVTVTGTMSGDGIDAGDLDTEEEITIVR